MRPKWEKHYILWRFLGNIEYLHPGNNRFPDSIEEGTGACPPLKDPMNTLRKIGPNKLPITTNTMRSMDPIITTAITGRRKRNP